MKERVMVCVTRQKTCARLIKLGALLAERRCCELTVVHALRPEDPVLGSADESEALEFLCEETSRYGGEMKMIRSEDSAGALVDCANECGATMIVLGASPKTEPVSFAERMRQRLPDTEIICVEADSFDQNIHITMNADIA